MIIERIKMICGIVVAHNEDLILEHTLSKLTLPYIAVLDNPTPRVRQLTSEAIATLEAPPQEFHVYNWENILTLIKQAALCAKISGYKWVIRIDADEDWTGVEDEILKADEQDYNIVNFLVEQYKPLKDIVSTFTPEDQTATHDGDAIHLEPDGNYYQRAWKLDTDIFSLGGGGHVILREVAKVYQSEYKFKHYPAIDNAHLIKKANRIYNQEEKNKGWHIQYNWILDD